MQPRPKEATVETPLGRLDFGASYAAAVFVTLARLLQDPEFARAGATPRELPQQLHARHGGSSGVAVIGPRGALFIEDGQRTLDAAVGANVAWPTSRAMPLAHLLVRLPPEARAVIERRLLEAKCAHWTTRDALDSAYDRSW